MLQEIRTSCEPAVIGVRNGLYQTEFIDAKSFPSKDVKDKFADVFTNPLNLSAFKDECVKAFALKRAKQTDIVSCDSGIFDLDFLISQKAADVIKSFKINNLIKVPVEIDGWSGKYFAVSFPKYGVNIVNFPESIFVYQDYDKEQGKFIDIVRSINAPDEYGDLMTQIVPRKISLSQKVKDKAFHINGMGLFFSRDILDAFLSEQISGFSLHDAFVLA
ncbi:MAG: hypothetical protein D8H92_08500 [Campylobacter sp.]|nr:MAG: hypothetical protein D8H92_08500 [Campylobacter sp.]